MLEVRGLDAFYGDSHVLQGIDLSLAQGERVALVGRNGAGKSTFLKSVMGAGPGVRGTISWDGKDLRGAEPYERARRGLCFVPEDRRILANLTVFENLRMAYEGTPAGRRSGAPEQVMQSYPMLQPIRDRLGGFLSGGQQQLLALARGEIANPRLLLLDEPTEGLAPVIVEAMVDDVLRICADGRCGLILCEQSLWFARRCTERVYVIDTGRIVFAGNWDEFDANDEVRRKHLSVAA